MRIRSVLSHSTQAVAEGALISLLVVGLMAGSALAAKGGGSRPSGGGSGSSVSVVLLNSTDGIAHYGQQVTFNVSTTVSQPSVKLECFQAGVRVYYGSAGFYPEYPWPWAQTFTLSSGAWTGGAANCTATLYYFNGRSYPTLATQSFAVAA